MKTNPDYGKEMRAVLDWTDEDLLREMLRLRIVSGLGESGRNLTFSDVWTQLCASHYKGEETSAVFIERCLMRPRNLLKIFNHCRGFAANFNRSKINEGDITKGLRAYSLDLFNELVRELSDVIPDSIDVLYQFIDAEASLPPDDVIIRVMNAGLSEERANEVIDLLLYYGVLGICIGGKQYYIFDVNCDIRVLSTRIKNSSGDFTYMVNPAFWPALQTRLDETGSGVERLLL